MAIQQSLYGQISDRVKPGDIIAFSGKNRFSRLARLATGSIISHVGIVCEIGNGLHLIESVSFKQKSDSDKDPSELCHKQINSRIDKYNGLVWWLPLSADSRALLSQEKLCSFLLSTDSKSYDIPQAIRAVLDMIEENSFFDLSAYKQEDLDTFCCAEMAAAALEAGGVIENINPSAVTPASLCSFKIFAEDYFQLKGRRQKLDGYNGRDPEGFGVHGR